MRLSEAIREGCKGTTQAFGYWQTGEGTACVVEAAARGFGVPHWAISDRVEMDLRTPCPVGCEVQYMTSLLDDQTAGPAKEQLWPIMVHLNDHHRWTREQIADWVQAQEAIHGIGIEAPAETAELVGA